MLHYEESPEKPQYNMATPFLHNPLHFALLTPPPPLSLHFHQIWKSQSTPYMKGGSNYDLH